MFGGIPFAFPVAMASLTLIDELHDSFRNLCKLSEIDFSTAEQIWKVIVEKHSEPQRFYHTLQHIHELYENYQRISSAISPDARSTVLWTIFFHDIVYDPLSKTNEEDSAFLFKTLLQPYLANELVADVKHYILATKTHQESALSTTDENLRIFLDLDLGILAANAERYSQYAQQIRQEYIHFEDSAYRQGRSQVLLGFLGGDSTQRALSESVPALFTSIPFRDVWGPLAVQNIQWELSELSKEPHSQIIFS